MSISAMRSDVLEAFRAVDRANRMNLSEVLNALEEFAPVLSCWANGHPKQPSPRKKWSQRPWRCSQCGTWWVTRHTSDYSDYDVGGHWEWKRVENDIH